MNLTDFVQFGVAGVAIVAIVYIVKEFLKNQNKRDKTFMDFIKDEENEFKNTINNHLEGNSKASLQLSENINKLSENINKILNWLENRNGRSK